MTLSDKITIKEEKQMALNVLNNKIEEFLNDDIIETREFLQKIIAQCESLIITDF